MSTTRPPSTSVNHPLKSLSAYPAKIIELASLTYDKKFSSAYTENISNIYRYTTAITPTIEEFRQFLRAIHNTLLDCDIYLKCLCFRIIRTCFTSPDFCRTFVSEDVHHIVVRSIEKDPEFIRERKEALKLMYTYLKIDPELFPLSFGRSLIALASQNRDNMQVACIEVLRELSVSNTDVFVKINGPKTLMDIILDPECERIQGSLLCTFALVYSNPAKRRYVRLFSDFRYLLSPLSDVDFVPSSSSTSSSSSSPKDLASETASATIAKWNAAMRVLTFYMRTYFGLILLSSDNLGFPLIADMLTISKVPQELTNIILDGIYDICRPFINKYCASEKLSSNYGVSIVAASDSLMDSRPRFSYQETATSSLSTSNATAPTLIDDKLEKRKSSMFDTLKSTIFNRKSSVSVSSSPKLADIAASAVQIQRNHDALIQQIKVEIHSGNVGEILDNISNGSTNAFEVSSVNCLTDPYCSLLCCSIINSKLLNKLCHLAIHGQQNIAAKSKKLLINILRMILNVFPTHMNKSVELLIFPSLLEYAANVVTPKSPTKDSPIKAFKASQIIQELNETFSLTHFNIVNKTSSLVIYPLTFQHRERSASISSEPYPPIGGIQSERTSIPIVDVCKNLLIISQGDIGTSSSGLGTFAYGHYSLSKSAYAVAAADSLSNDSNNNNNNNNNNSSNNSSNNNNNGPRMSYAATFAGPGLAPLGASPSSGLVSQARRVNLNRDMELSRIIGKEGKEPSKWDWAITLNTLNDGLNSPGLIDEALSSKWIKRLSGFYRCEIDEKAYFVNSDWHPNNFVYTECACKMYKLLLEDSKGLKFLQDDRRGIFFDGLNQQLNLMLEEVICKVDSSCINAVRSVFRPWSCSFSLSREYFTILGRLQSAVDGRKLLETTNVFEQLLSLGGNPSLDYLSRLVISSLALSDHGVFSKFLMAAWHGQKACSVNLKKYIYNLLMVILQSEPMEFYNWCIDLLLDFMSTTSKQDDFLCDIFELACQDVILLRKIVTSLTTSFALKGPRANVIYSRFAVIPEGIAYLTRSNLLSELITYWQAIGCEEYKKTMHQNINKTLLPEFLAAKNAAPSPIMLESKKFSSFTISKSSINTQLTQINGCPSTLHIDAGAASVDVEGLFKCPWVIEVKCCTQGMNSVSNIKTLSAPQGSAGEYLKLDTFVDSSSFPHPLHSSSTKDPSRVVMIRGIVTNVHGAPEGKAITSSKGCLCSTLAIGTSPINKDGSIGQPVKMKSTAASDDPNNSTTSFTANNMRESLFAGSSKQSQSSSPSASFQTLADSLDAYSINHETDVPVSFQNDPLFNWSDINPSNRRGENSIIKELDDEEDLFSVAVVGEPVVWIFSRKGPFRHPDYIDSYPKRPAAKGALYLIEVQYHIRFETEQPLFSPISYHLYGQLCATKEGAALLQKNIALGTLLFEARAMGTNFHTSACALWSLGHICSFDHGFNLIIKEDRTVLDWLISNVCTHEDINIRGVTFQALCMLSKSKVASSRLSDLNWECYHSGVTAIAIPRKSSSLFNLETVQGGLILDEFTQQIPVNIPPLLQNLSPDPTQKFDSVEMEVLNCIAKLPGIVKIFEKSKSRIEQIKMQSPEVFSSKELYKSVLDLFSLYPFRLSVRREVMKLFTLEAQKKDN